MNRKKRKKLIAVVDLQEVGCGDINWIDVNQNRNMWQALVLYVMIYVTIWYDMI